MKTKKFDVKSEDNEVGWLYTDKVKDHFFNPRNIFKTKEEEEEFEKKADGIGQVGSPACIIPGTLIYLQEGWKEIEKVDKNNKVLGYSGSFDFIQDKKIRKYSGNLISLKTKLGGINLTPDHLIFSIRRPKGHKYDYTKNKYNLPPEWNHAKNLKKNDFIIYPLLNEINDINEINVNYTPKKFDFRSKDIPYKLRVTPELLRLFGYFIAEGSTRKNNLKAKEVTFTFSDKEKKYVDDVVYLIKKYFGLKANIIKNASQKRYDVSIYSVHLSDLFKKWFGSGAENKKIPSFLMYFPPEKQKELLCGLWRGDGYINITRKFIRAGYASISKVLINQIKILLFRQRIIPSIYNEKEKTSKWAHHKPAYRIHVGDPESVKKILEIVQKRKSKFQTKQENSWFDQDFFYTPITKIDSKYYSGFIHNLEVKSSHSYTTEAFCVHNCGDVMRMYIKVDKKTDTITACKFKTFGCASAIASTSVLSEMVIGMKLEEAKKITPQDIVKELGGLPTRKIHCSVLGDQALRAAIEDYEKKKKLV